MERTESTRLRFSSPTCSWRRETVAWLHLIRAIWRKGQSAPCKRPAAPVIRTIGLSDLNDALRRGWEDFKAVPSHAIVLCLIYPVLGLVLARTVLGYSVLPLLFPLAAGFALLGPFAALGLYELSRRRENGEQASAWDAVEVLRSPSFGAMVGLGTLLLALFVTWVATAQAIYVAAFGYAAAAGIPDFLERVLTTSQGWWLIVVGCGVGSPVRGRRVVHQRSFIPADARPSRQRRRCHGNLAARGRTKPCSDGRLGFDRGRAFGPGLVAAVPRSGRGHPTARPRDMASLSQGDCTGSQSATDNAPAISRAAPCGRFPSRAVSVATQGWRLAMNWGSIQEPDCLRMRSGQRRFYR